MFEIVAILDYIKEDRNAWVQVKRRLRRLCPNAVVDDAPVENLSTIHTGFWALVHSLEDPLPGGTLLYINTAPGAEQPGPCPNNRREPLVVGRLGNRVGVLAINSGYSLSWLRSDFTELYEVLYDPAGSQWRSRDAMPAVVRAIMDGTLKMVTDALPRLGRRLNPLDPQTIPCPPPGVRVVHVDGVNNIKLSLRASAVREWRVGTTVAVKIGDCDCVYPVYRAGTFEVSIGQWVIAPGSDGRSDRFLELWIRRGGTNHPGAAGLLQGVHVGDLVQIEPLAEGQHPPF